jgi:hypothetical protein
MLDEVGAYLTTPGAPAPTGSNHVLDVGELVTGASKAGVTSWDQVTFSLKATLADWPAASGTAARSRPVAGDPYANGDNQALSGFGWPEPPAKVGPLDRAAGVTSTTLQVDRPKDANVRLEFTDSKGAKLSDIQGARSEIAGARMVTDDAHNLVTYTLPRQDYAVTISGTGGGTAPITVTSGDFNETANVYRVPARTGTDGDMRLAAYGIAAPLTYGGTLAPRAAGLTMKLDGIPKTVPEGTIKDYQLKVTDERGDAVPDATVKVEGGDVVDSAVTDASGKASLTLIGPAAGAGLVATTTAARHAPLAAIKILAARPEVPPVTAAERRYIGPDQTVYLPRKPGSPLAVVELAATLFVSALGIGYLRSRPG